ncbi:MAG: DJ-1/PfpI family protein [Alphaproteobacteria bacterium]|nr:DJ-1/PfpI family protein [Alphaproteobacteria bacterium]
MQKPLVGTKVAVLVANGFEETQFIAMQRRLQEMGASLKIISTNQGLVNGWNGSGWGHNFAVDAQLNTALGVDYDALVIPGGSRSMEKLKLTAHTRRFIGSFMAAQKAVAVMDDALHLMAFAEQLDGHTVAGNDDMRSMATQAGASWEDAPMYVDGSMLTGRCDADNMDAFMEAMKDVFMGGMNNMMDQAA